MLGKLLLATSLLVAIVGVTLSLASRAWRRASARSVASLSSSARPVQRGAEALPPPVSRYLELALPEGTGGGALVRVAHKGEFRLREDLWRPFDSVEHFSARPPGFIWDARIRMAPGIEVRVRDGYASGRGSMTAKLLGLLTLVEARGRSELDSAALQRFLAEAVWYPEALLPGPGLRWSAVDAVSAEATLRDGENEVSLTFRFGEVGEVVSVETPSRFREVEGDYVPTPWRGRFERWERRGPFWIPLSGEVEWVLPEGPFPYWRGSVATLDLVSP